MTFYNVVSGLLFLGAVQQMALGLAAWEAAHIVMGCLLAAIVFNDALYTSHVVEGEKTVAYQLPLMLRDLFNFLLLALAIVALNPKKNVFDADLSQVFCVDPSGQVQWFAETWYWSVLGVYWISIMIWTYRAGMYDPETLRRRLFNANRISESQLTRGRNVPYPHHLFLAAIAVAIMFFVQALFVGLGSDLGGWVRRFIALAYFTVYVTWLRRRWVGEWERAQLAAIRGA